MPKCPYEYIKIISMEYSPKEYQNQYKKLPLITHIFGVSETGKSVHLQVLKVRPRFWTKQNPYDLNIEPDMLAHITEVVYDECQTYSETPEPLYTVYMDYPYTMTHSMYRPRGLRGYFDWTGQADIPFRDAVRYFYGWKDIIRIPNGKRKLFVEEIVPVNDNKIHIETNDVMLDIEAFNDDGSWADGKYPTGKIYCWSIKNLKNGDIYHATILDIDEEKVRKCIADGTYLYQNCTINKKKYKKDHIEPVKSRVFIDIFHDERALLLHMKDILESLETNIIEGFNVIDFDISYIRNRIAKMNRNIKKRGDNKYYRYINFNQTQPFDLMEGYRTYRHKSSLTVEDKRVGLDWLGLEEIGYGKIIRPDMIEMRDNDPDLMSIYNIWDVELPARIEEKMGILNYYKIYCAKESGCSIDHYASMVFLAESAVMHEVKCKEIFPSRKFVPQISMEKIGAAIDEASTGVQKKMIEVDLSGQYPGAIMTGNLDIKTKLEFEIPGVPFVEFPSGRKYRLDFQGTIPGMMHELREKREKVRKIMKDLDNDRDNPAYQKAKKDQEIIKHSMASWSGGFGTVEGKTDFVARFADNGIYNDITEISRLLKGWNKNKIEGYSCLYDYINNRIVFSDYHVGMPYLIINLTVKYGDTDSCKCTINDCEELEKKMGREFTKKDLEIIGEHYAEMLNESYTDFSKQYLGVSEHYFFVKAEEPIKAYYQWGKKKLYVELDFNDERHDKGVGTVRSDKGKLMKEVMDYSLDRIVKEEMDKLPEYLAKIEQKVKNGDYNLELGTPQRIKVKTNHWYNNMMLSNKFFKDYKYNFKLFDKPTFFYLKKLDGQVLPPNSVVAFKPGDNPVEMGASIDYKKHLKIIKTGLEGIFAGLELDWDSIVTGMKKRELGEYF
jgi:DNA polymerase elongation subunit (family B)